MKEPSPNTLTENPEVVTRMNEVAQIIQTYYPESSPDWDVWIPETFHGFEVVGLVIEDELNAHLNIIFYQDLYEEGFPLNPYRLNRVEFWGESTEEDGYPNVAYVYENGDTGVNWVGKGTPTQPDNAINLCMEVLDTLIDLAISFDFGRVFSELPPKPKRFEAQQSKSPEISSEMSPEQLAELTEAIKRSLSPG